MKRIFAFVVLLAMLVSITGMAAAAGFSAGISSSGAQVAGGAVLDLRGNFFQEAGQTEKKQILITVTCTGEGNISAFDIDLSYDSELVTFVSAYKTAGTMSATTLSSSASAGKVNVYCYGADAPSGAITVLKFNIADGATGTPEFKITSGYAGVREGLDIPEAIIGSGASLEVSDGHAVDATKIQEAAAGNGTVDVTFDGSPASSWIIVTAAYSGGKQVHCAVTPASGSATQSIPFAKAAGESVKVFVINSTAELKPIMGAYTI